jgi:hypothetical protein
MLAPVEMTCFKKKGRRVATDDIRIEELNPGSPFSMNNYLHKHNTILRREKYRNIYLYIIPFLF